VQPISLFELSPHVDRAAGALRFAAERRVQIRDFLTLAAAQAIHGLLSRETPWGLAWRAGSDGPHSLRRQQLAATPAAELNALSGKVAAAMRRGDYAFAYAHYPMLNAYLGGWNEHEALDLLLEHINSDPLLNLVREVTGIATLAKADAQATLYGPNHFLAVHDDSHVAEGWRVAYVMSFCADDWRPDWGGYLMFYDEDGDVVAGYRPRFNALNLFAVPLRHNVTYVPPFAPAGRFSITGWFRDA
jgi:Rps23 Pro-64 3,4-dihydroxylase Tpa1-like proline 4-hydroxylase